MLLRFINDNARLFKMHGDYVEINIEVTGIADNYLMVKVNGKEYIETISFNLIRDSYTLKFDINACYEVEVLEDLAFKRGWI